MNRVEPEIESLLFLLRLFFCGCKNKLQELDEREISVTLIFDLLLDVYASRPGYHRHEGINK